jgi:hypothetical protein
LKGRTLDALQVAASYGFIVGVLALGLVAALSSVTWLLERFILACSIWGGEIGDIKWRYTHANQPEDAEGRRDRWYCLFYLVDTYCLVAAPFGADRPA